MHIGSCSITYIKFKTLGGKERETSPNSLRPYTWQEALDAKQAARPLVEASALSLKFKFLCAAGPGKSQRALQERETNNDHANAAKDDAKQQQSNSDTEFWSLAQFKS